MAPPAATTSAAPQPIVGGVQTTTSYQQQLQQQQQFQQQLQQQQQRMQALEQQQQAFRQSTAEAAATSQAATITTTPTTLQPSAMDATASGVASTSTTAAPPAPAALASAAASGSFTETSSTAIPTSSTTTATSAAAEASAAAAAAEISDTDAQLLKLAQEGSEDDTPQRGTWNEVEDNILRAAVTSYNGKNWGKIAEHLPGRTPVQCLSHWKNVLNSRVVKGKGSWTPEEDEKLKEIVLKFGPKNWSSVIAPHLPSRMGKQCRERWHNHLNPSLKKTPWSEQEEQVAAKAHDDLGNKWADIAKQLPGRSDNEVKNHWYASLRRRKTRLGQLAGDEDGDPDEEGPGAAGKRKTGPKRTQSVAASRAAAGGGAGAKSKRARTGSAGEARAGVGTAAAVAAAAVAAAAAISNKQLGGLKTSATTGKQTPEQVVAQAQAQQLLMAQELHKRDGSGVDAADALLGAGLEGDEGDERDGRYLGRWSAQEGATLLSLVDKFGPKNWAFIAAHLPGRTDIQCLQHWRHVLNPNVVKGRGSWTPSEDVKLKELVDKYGPKKWASAIAIHLPGRMGKQCRERWHNTLNPGLTRAPWTIEEEMILATNHDNHGNKWAVISKELPGRSDNDVKNHFYASLRRKKTKIALAREENQAGAENEAEEGGNVIIAAAATSGGAGAGSSSTSNNESDATIASAALQAAAQATLAARNQPAVDSGIASTRAPGQPYDVAAAAQAAAMQVGQLTPSQQQQQHLMQLQLQQQLVGQQQQQQQQYLTPAHLQAQQAAQQAAQLAQAQAQTELSRLT